MINPIRVIRHVDGDVLRGMERAIVAIAAAVHLGAAQHREQAGSEAGEETEQRGFHEVCGSLPDGGTPPSIRPLPPKPGRRKACNSDNIPHPE